MKNIVKIILLLIPLGSYGQAGIKGYYFFQFPSKDIFYHPFALAGKANNIDPFTTEGSGDNNITEDDLEVSPSLKSQAFSFSNVTTRSVLNSYSSTDSIKITGSFFKVKTVKLKPVSYRKLDIGNYHVTEALKADSVVIKILSTKKRGFGTLDAQKIVLGLTGAQTVVAVVGKILGLESTQIYKVANTTNDSIVFVNNNPETYFAARFTMLGDPAMAPTIGAWISGRIPAPCYENGTFDSSLIQLNGTGNPIVRQILSCNKICSGKESINARLEFIYNRNLKFGQVRLVKVSSNGAANKEVLSEKYDLESFAGSPVSSTLTLFNKSEPKNVNVYINADYRLVINPDKSQIIVSNRLGTGAGVSQTCFYTTRGKFSYWPQP